MYKEDNPFEPVVGATKGPLLIEIKYPVAPGTAFQINCNVSAVIVPQFTCGATKGVITVVCCLLNVKLVESVHPPSLDTTEMR